MLISTYYKNLGEEAVKALFKSWGNDDDAIEGVLTHLRQMHTDS